MAYVCEQCGRHQLGESSTRVCPACAPPQVRPTVAETMVTRCEQCNGRVTLASTAPSFECPQCGRQQTVRR